MELMGMMQNPNISRGTENVTSRNSSLSKNSSESFEKEIGQFSKDSKQENFQKEIPRQTPEPKQLQEYSNQSDGQPRENSQLPGVYRKPVAPTRIPADVQVVGQEPQHASNLTDEAILKQAVKGVEQLSVDPKSQNVDSLTRRAAIQTFILRMKDKLGVESTEIVGAFHQLTPNELALPPEANIEKVISHLNLDPKGEQQAQLYFNQMLAQSSADSFAEYLKGTDRELSLSVMSQQQIRQAQIEKSVGEMGSKFFTNPQQQIPMQAQSLQGHGPTPQQPQQQQVTTPDMFFASQPAMETTAVGKDVQGPILAQNMEIAPTSSMAPNSVGPEASLMKAQGSSQGLMTPQNMTGKGGMELNSQHWAQAPQEMNFESPISQQDFYSQMMSKTQNVAAKQAYGMQGNMVAPQPQMGAESFTQSVSGVPIDGMSAVTPAAPGFDGFESGGFEESSSQDPSMLEGSQQSLSEFATDGGEVEGQEFQVKVDGANEVKGIQKTAATTKPMMVNHQPTDGEQAENVREVISQANLLIKKGGGEMKVALNPEGLGKIDMKVGVENGQVSVEMVAESSEAKKVLEKGLGDLKASLASHKLNVENVKVDFSGEVAKQFDHAHDEAQRQSAQQFMQEFSQRNSAWRREFTDIPGARMSDHSSEGDNQMSIDAVRKKKDSNRRLDLVA